MIKNREPLSMAEATDLIDKERGADFLAFIKKFTKTKTKDAENIRKSLASLDLMKLDDKTISKIIDLLPENEEELSKIFVGISLDDEETKKVLGVLQK